MAQIKIAEYVMTNGSNVLPTLTPSTVTVTTEDTVGDSTTTRILYCDETALPTAMSFKDERNLIEVEYIYTSCLTSAWQMFMGCTKLKTVRADDWDVSHIETFNGFFMDCSSLQYFYANNWNVTGITSGSTLWSFFFGCSSLTSVDLSTWTTPSDFPITMGYFFQSCSKLVSVNLSSWSMNSHENMFTNCSSLRTIIAKGISSTTANNLLISLNSVTNGTITISTIDGGEVDTSYATGLGWTVNIDAARIIAKYKFTTSVDTLPTFNTDYTYIVLDTINEDGTTTRTIANEHDIAPTSMRFSSTGLLEVYELDVSGLTSFSNLFYGCEKLTTIHGHENWDTTKITSFNATFQSCKKLQSLDMTNWDVSNVTSFDSTFYACDIATSFGDLSKWNVSKATSMYFMFRRCSKITTLGDISNWDVSKCTNFRFMFFQSGLIEIDITNWKYIETESNLRVDGMFGSNNNLISIKGLENMPSHLFNNVTQMFYGSSKITTLEGLSEWKITNKITALTSMFANCSSLTTLDLSGWDVSKVTVTTSCFDGCTNLVSLNIDGWDLSSTTTTTSMFNKTTSLATIEMSECPVDTINTIIGLIPTKTSTGTISTTVPKDQASNIDTVTATSKMWNIINRFIVAKYKMQTNSNTLPISIQPSDYRYTDVHNEDDTTTRTIYNTESPTAMNFNGKTGLLEVLFLDMSNISNVSSMFNRCNALTKVNADGWTLEKVSNISSMFSYCSVLTELDLSSFNLSNVTNMQSMFNRCSALTTIGDTSNWNVGKVTSMNYMFEGCSSLEVLDVSKWDVSSLKTMTQTFNGCSKLTELDVSNWNTGSITGLTMTFDGCSSLSTLDTSNWNTSSVTSMGSTFKNCSSLTFLDVSKWDVSKVTTFSATFQGCSNLETLDVSKWDVSSVSIFQNTFNGCNKLTSLNVDEWNTSSATNMGGLFYGCASLTSLDLSSFTTNQVTYLRDMFNGCSNLQMLDLSNFNTDIVTDTTRVFGNCTALKDIGLVYCNVSTVNTIVSLVPTNVECNVYYYDADKTQLTPVEGVTFKKYVMPTKIQLPPHIQLHSLSDGTRDEVDIKTGILIRRTQKIDNEIVALESPTTEQLILNYNNSCDYGRILPTGICDKYDVVNSMYTQTMTSIPLNGVNAWDDIEDLGTVLKFTATGTTVGVDNLNMKGAGGLYCDNDLFPNINDDSDVEHCRVDEAGNKFYIYISKDRLMSPDLIGYQIWLQTNPFNMWYELEEHLIYTKPYEELDPTQARWDTMDCFRDGSIKYNTHTEDGLTIYPTLEYVAPSINNFEVPMLEPNTEYTMYAEGIGEGDTINLGGTDIEFANGTVYTSGENQWLRIDNNDSFYNVVVTKGDTTGEVVPYFEGMTSVENPKVECRGGDNLIGVCVNPTERIKKYKSHLKPNTNYTLIQYKTDGSQNNGTVSLWSNNTQIESYAPSWWCRFTTNENVTSETLLGIDSWNNELVVLLLEGTHSAQTFEEVLANPYKLSTVSYTDLKLRSLPNGVKDTLNVLTGEHIQRIGEREYQEGDLTNTNVLTDSVITAYELTEPIITKLDTQELLAYEDGAIRLSSDTGFLPTVHYSVPSTNVFNLPSIKTGTRYTLKYPSASGSISIGDMTYKVTSPSMLFTTPLTLSGDASAVVFTDTNPQDVMLIEGDYSKREMSFFERLRSSENIAITTTYGDSTNTVETGLTLRSLPNGLSDKLNLVTGKLVRVADIRDYQEGDNTNKDVYTDGYKTVYPLTNSIETTVEVAKPVGYSDGVIQLKSDALIPTFRYRLPSSNNFVLDLLKPSTKYTMYANYELDGNFTLGGTMGTIGNAKVVSTSDSLTDTNLTFSGNLGLSNVMLVEGDSTQVTTPKFNGLLSVENATVQLTGSPTEINRLTIPDTVKLRSIGSIIDELDLVTGVFTKRIERVKLIGSENWQLGSHQSTNYQSFKIDCADLKQVSLLDNMTCDRFKPLAWTTLTDKAFEFITGNGTIEINIRKENLTTPDVDGFKRWLRDNPTTVHYELSRPVTKTLDLAWTTKPVTSYYGATTVQSTSTDTQTLKPYFQIVVPITSLEEIVDSLKEKNARLEEDNLATMIAVTEVFEVMLMMMPVNMAVSNQQGGGSYMVEVYVTLILKGKKTLEQVPAVIRPQVEQMLKDLDAI